MVFLLNATGKAFNIFGVEHTYNAPSYPFKSISNDFNFDQVLKRLDDWIEHHVQPYLDETKQELEWEQFEKRQHKDLSEIFVYNDSDIVLEEEQLEKVKLLFPLFIEQIHNTVDSSPEQKEKSDELVIRIIHEIEIKQEKKETITRGEIMRMGSSLIIGQLLDYPYEHWQTIVNAFKDAIIQVGSFLLP